MSEYKPRAKLSEKQVQFINAYMKRPQDGAAGAARVAGYDPSAASRLLAHPTIAGEIEKRRESAREATDYDVKKAMIEAEEHLDIARAKGQMMACAKFIELRMKLMGLLVEKLDVRQQTNFRINILGMGEASAEPLALNTAREVFDVVNPGGADQVADNEVIDDKDFETPQPPIVEEDIFGL